MFLRLRQRPNLVRSLLAGHFGPQPVVQREEVILPEKTLRLLERNVHDFIRNRERLRELGLAAKKGLLFYGPPGTGKTHTIRYLAGQLRDHTTLLITAEQVGLLDEYFQLARFLQPAMLVIEDVDLIARARVQRGKPEREAVGRCRPGRSHARELSTASAVVAALALALLAAETPPTGDPGRPS
jgi:DNA polymerase III delta prime subunit